MKRFLFTFILGATALAQTQAPAVPQGTAGSQLPAQSQSGRASQGPQTLPTLPAPDPAASVPASQPVITIHGECSNSEQIGSTDAGSCTTVLTKEQFEKLLDAINTNNQPIPPQMRRNLAQALVGLMTFAQAAEKAGIANDPKFQEVMRVVRMRTLQDMYQRSAEQKSRNTSPQEIENYYNQNSGKYVEVKLGRIFVPRTNATAPAAQDKGEFEKKAEQVADDMRARALKGEDLEKLQREAYTTLGLTTPPPSSDAGTRRKGMMMPQEEEEVFSLKSGEFSKVEKEPTGFIIYKVISKQTVPLDQVKDEISRELFRQKMEAQAKAITESVHTDYNDQYFGPAPAAPASSADPGAGSAATQPKSPAASTTKPASTSAAPSAQSKKAPPK